MTDDPDLAEIRRLLEARQHACWLRLEDAVSELAAVHGVALHEIVERVHAVLDDER